MYKKVLLLILMSVVLAMYSSRAQQSVSRLDSVAPTQFEVDSLDSVGLVPVKAPDTLTPNLLKPLDSISVANMADSLAKGFGFPTLNFEALYQDFMLGTLTKSVLQKGDVLPKGELWILATVAVLLIIFAVLKQSFSKQLGAIVQSFFSNRALSNLNKEDNLFTSWPFLLLFVQFGFTLGLFLYLVAKSQANTMLANGLQSYVTISVLIIILYVLKILVLRMLGIVFNIQKPVNEYVSILYLSYFNSSLLFMPLVIAFALTPLKHSEFYIALAMVLIGIVFVFQIMRAGINILSHYRFSKVYLILYFCTLEICPILILIKAIGF